MKRAGADAADVSSCPTCYYYHLLAVAATVVKVVVYRYYGSRWEIDKVHGEGVMAEVPRGPDIAWLVVVLVVKRYLCPVGWVMTTRTLMVSTSPSEAPLFSSPSPPRPPITHHRKVRPRNPPVIFFFPVFLGFGNHSRTSAKISHTKLEPILESPISAKSESDKAPREPKQVHLGKRAQDDDIRANHASIVASLTGPSVYQSISLVLT